MKETFDLFAPTISADTGNATSSPASGSGATPSDKQGGLTTKKSGRAPAPASPSATPAREKRSMMSAIYGRTGSSSSESSALALSLANRLQAVSGSLGSTLYTLTWKARRTPSGRSIPALRASEARTSGSAFTGWQTPVANDAKGSGYAYGRGDHNCVELKLPGEAKLTGWPTPTKDEAGGTPEQFLARKARLDGACGVSVTALNLVATFAGWPTPMAGSKATEEYNEAGNTDSGRKTVALAGWATPRSVESGHGTGTPSRAQDHKSRLEDQVFLSTGPARLTASGELLTGSAARMESGGQLNPGHSRWLQALPAVWDGCAPTETRSTLKRRASSYAPTEVSAGHD